MRSSTALAALVLLAAFCGCQQTHNRLVAASEIHEITRELAKTASQTSPSGTLIKARRAGPRSSGASTDELYVGLHGSSSNADGLRQSLEGVATRRGLTVDPEEKLEKGVRLTFRSHGAVTHRVVIEALGTPPQIGATPASGSARLAILLDDLGSDRGAADEIFALRVPVTISVLPYHAHSQDIAEAAKKNGCEVMLHLPMQSVANETPERHELKPGFSQAQVREMVEEMLDALPEADGVNNHQGSQATADPALMRELMRVLKQEGVFYVDSRTTVATVAYDAAQQEGVPAAFRNVPFLDDVPEKNAVKHQVQLAIREAKQKGEAVAIGHPHPGTLEALREMLPEAKKQGVQLVPVSELVH